MIDSYAEADEQLAVHRRKETSILGSLEKMVDDLSQISLQNDNPLDQVYPLVLEAVLAGYSQEIDKVKTLVEGEAPLRQKINPAFLEAKIYLLACEDFINRKPQFHSAQLSTEIAEYRSMSPEDKSQLVDTLKTKFLRLAHPKYTREIAVEILNHHKNVISHGGINHYIVSMTGGSPEWDESGENLITLSYSSMGHFEAVKTLRDEYSHMVSEFASAIGPLERMPVANINGVIYKFHGPLNNYESACRELMQAKPPKTTISVPRRQVDNIGDNVTYHKNDFLRRFHPKYLP